MASFFSNVTMGPPIEVFALTKRFNDDVDPNKVNLGVGAYRTDESVPWVLPIVRQVELNMSKDQTLNHEYLPVAGYKAFRDAAINLILPRECAAVSENRVGGIQVQGGTGGIRLAAEFLKRNCGSDVVYVSKPTWGNHKTIFKHAGFSQIKEYRYWDPKTCAVDMNGFIEDLENAPEGAVVVLHAVAHNPTGMDPTNEQWKKIADTVMKKNLFPLLDCAYQGFASGDLDKDAFAIRLFESKGCEMFVAQSFSKNFGLYNERIGNLCIVVKDNQQLPNIMSQMEIIVRTMWSNPSNHGARIVATVLSSPSYFEEWKMQVKTMADRIASIRTLMYNKLREKKAPGDWHHIIDQIGMFSFTGLTQDQSKKMEEKHHVYMLSNGRISMAGLTTKNVDHVVEAMIDVLAG
ncbi:aspartate aminotransferase, cytoplasmic-like [Babylonia areolata]|uniref:aspartate aminotransferase, cytoplasmic-like n=1 Tax=Babylonia areolata TaxID=304850 RepID=UPI003FD0BCCB